jgi:nucleotide-binding universal stress UspA family protein
MEVDEYEHSDPTDSDSLVLSEALAGLAEEYPDLQVTPRLSRGLPVDALLTASSGARLLVVGTHGRHSTGQMWLGSVSHELVLALPCTVVVMRPGAVA